MPKNINKYLFTSIILTAIIVLLVAVLNNYFSLRTKTLPNKLSDVIEKCLNQNYLNYYSCFRKSITPIVQTYGVNPVVLGIEQIIGGQTNRYKGFSCHDLTHIVGEVAIAANGNLGETLINCTKTCQYGCAHGALIGAISSHPDILNNLSSVCEPFKNSTLQDMDACNHGLGHGISEYTDMNLMKSLDFCDKITSQTAKAKCAQGVFMQVTDFPDVPFFKITGSISDFCNSVPVDLVGACFETASLHEYGRSKDVQKSILVCSQIPSKYRSECVISIVNLIYANYEGSRQKLLDFCNSINPKDYNSCLKGAIEPDIIADNTASTSIFLCNSSTNKNHDTCFKMLGERYEYVYGKDRRLEFCSKLSNTLSRLCLTNEN